MEIWAIVVAAGTGNRFGRRYGSLKQLAPLGGRRVIDWSVAAVSTFVEGVIVVGPPELGDPTALGVHRLVSGGASRSDSVRAGLSAVPATATHVLVHDAARPLVSAAVVQRVVDALLDGASGVIPVVPVTDTIRSVDGAQVDRDHLVAVQTPQGFEIDVLKRAHGAQLDATDDATVVEAVGESVVHVDGAATNIKITFAHDLATAEAVLVDDPVEELR